MINLITIGTARGGGWNYEAVVAAWSERLKKS